MRKIAGRVLGSVLMLGAGSAFAEMWDTYSPSKAVWNITEVRVQPDKLDDYLTGLKNTLIPTAEAAKKNGSLISYRVLVNSALGAPGANVIIIEEYASWAARAPNKGRDLAVRSAVRQTVPKEVSEKQVQQFDQFRQFIDEGDYWSVEFDR